MRQDYPSSNADRNPNNQWPPQASSEQPVLLAQDDEQFIRVALAQDARLGMELLYRRYFKPLCSHAVKFVGSKAVAEDIVSELFCQFYANQTFADIKVSYRFYLFRSVRNRAYNYLRWELKRKADLNEVNDWAAAAEYQPDSMSEYEELYQDFDQAVGSLPTNRRRIYLMRRFEDMKYQEIADTLKLSVRTVEVQIYRANQHIRALLKDKWLLPILALLTKIIS